MNLVAALALASFVAAPVPKADPAKQAQDSFQGEWQMVAHTLEGKLKTKDDLVDTRIVVKGDTMTIHLRCQNNKVTFTLDPKANPPAIDLKPQDQLGKEIILQGIYKLEKDKITICSALDEGERPKEFKSTESSRTIMLVLERVQK